MPKVHCAKRMEAAIQAAMDFVNEKQSMYISVDIYPECREDWGPNNAIVYFNVEADSGEEYIDVYSFRRDLIAAMAKALGHGFVERHRPVGKKDKPTPGQLYYTDHGGEFEIYRA